MKKNNMMRIASVLLVAVMLTSCVIAGTFAKYVTADSDFDQARVAKWGVEITADGEMFKDVYAKDDALYTKSENSVDSADGADVVAPGTEGTLAALTVEGSPEVAVRVSYVATLTLENWEVDGDEYCPIIITVNSEDFYVGKDGIADIDALQTAVKTAIEGKTADYAPNSDLSTEVDDDVNVSWRWEFDGAAPGATLAGTQTDVKDTALGDAATAATIKLDIATTITQID